MYLVSDYGNIDVTTSQTLTALGSIERRAERRRAGNDGANGIDARVYGLTSHIEIISNSDINSTDDAIYAFSTSSSSKYYSSL